MVAKMGRVYGLKCSCHPGDGYRYIGRTMSAGNERMRGHRYNARRGSELPVYKWMRKHGVDNILVDYIFRGESLAEVNAEEMALISKHGTHVSRGGLNVTLGGDGSTGFPQTPEMISRANAKRAANRGPRKQKPPRPRKSEDEKARNRARNKRLGEDTKRSKLSNADVLKIKEQLWSGFATRNGLAELYHVHKNTIACIDSGKTWSHIPWPIGPRVAPIGREKWRRDYLMTEKNPFRAKQTSVRAARLENCIGEASVREIRHLWANGRPVRLIADQFGISRSSVYRILRGEAWGWVT